MAAPRTRRAAAVARETILDVAERHLARHGPDGVRLTELAAELGVSHPALLHHFGNREALVREAALRVTQRLERELLASLTAAAQAPATRRRTKEARAVALLERVFDVLAHRNYARTLAWLYLSNETAGDPFGHGEQMMRIARVLHTLRPPPKRGARAAKFDDTLFVVVLASLALFGHSVAANALRSTAGIDEHAFLSWLSRLLVEHFER